MLYLLYLALLRLSHFHNLSILFFLYLIFPRLQLIQFPFRPSTHNRIGNLLIRITEKTAYQMHHTFPNFPLSISFSLSLFLFFDIKLIHNNLPIIFKLRSLRLALITALTPLISLFLLFFTISINMLII